MARWEWSIPFVHPAFGWKPMRGRPAPSIAHRVRQHPGVPVRDLSLTAPSDCSTRRRRRVEAIQMPVRGERTGPTIVEQAAGPLRHIVTGHDQESLKPAFDYR